MLLEKWSFDKSRDVEGSGIEMVIIEIITKTRR